MDLHLPGGLKVFTEVLELWVKKMEKSDLELFKVNGSFTAGYEIKPLLKEFGQP